MSRDIPAAAHSCEQYGMCEHQRTVLRDNRLYMQENIYMDENILAHLVAKGVLTTNSHEEINNESKTNKKMSKLLDILPTRGPKAFDIFCDVLVENFHEHVANKLLKEEKRAHDIARLKPNRRQRENLNDEILELCEENKQLQDKNQTLKRQNEDLMKKERRATKILKAACDLTERMVNKISKNPQESGYFSREIRAIEKTKEVYRQETEYFEFICNIQDTLSYMEDLCTKLSKLQAHLMEYEDFREKNITLILDLNVKLEKSLGTKENLHINDDCGLDYIVSEAEKGINSLWEEYVDVMEWNESYKQQIREQTHELQEKELLLISRPAKSLIRELEAALITDGQEPSKFMQKRVGRYKEKIEEIDDFLKEQKNKTFTTQNSRTSHETDRQGSYESGHKSNISPQDQGEMVPSSNRGDPFTVVKQPFQPREVQLTGPSKSSSSEGTVDEKHPSKTRSVSKPGIYKLDVDKSDEHLSRDKSFESHRHVGQSDTPEVTSLDLMAGTALNYKNSFAPKGLGKQRLLKPTASSRKDKDVNNEITIAPTNDTAKQYQLSYPKEEKVWGNKPGRPTRQKVGEKSSQQSRKLVYLKRDEDEEANSRPSSRQVKGRSKPQATKRTPSISRNTRLQTQPMNVKWIAQK